MITSRMFVRSVALFALGVVLAGCVSTSVPKSSPMEVVEIITLRLRDGVTDSQFLAANQRVESEHVVGQPGFLSRQTARADNGEWLVLVHWTSISAAEASMASFASAPATQGFMAVIDGSSLIMKRYTSQN